MSSRRATLRVPSHLQEISAFWPHQRSDRCSVTGPHSHRADGVGIQGGVRVHYPYRVELRRLGYACVAGRQGVRLSVACCHCVAADSLPQRVRPGAPQQSSPGDEGGTLPRGGDADTPP